MSRNLTLKTPPAIEPISLTEIKDYLRLSVDDGSGGVETLQTITPGVQSPGTVTGLSVEVLGYFSTVSLSVGGILATGTLDAKIQHSNDGITWADDQSFVQVTSSNDNAIFSLQYLAGKRYIRVAAVITNAQVEFSAEVQKQVGDTGEDAYLSAIITAAREYCEGFQNRAYITQSWELSFDYWPHCTIIDIPRGNLQTIDSISYKDSLGNVTTLTENTHFLVSNRGILGRISPPYAKFWPPFVPFPLDAIVIEFTCGYGDSPSDVPAKVIQAMKLLVSHWYENRVPLIETAKPPKELEFTLSALLWQDRVVPV